MSEPIKLLLADDHPLFCQGLRQALEKEAGFRILGEAHDGERALTAVRSLKPDILITDIEMPKVNGLDLARTLGTEKVKIIFLTMHKLEQIFNEAMDLGVMGYILKEWAHTEICQCVRTVATGQRFVSPAMTEFILARSDRARNLKNQKPGLASLTPAEKLILKLISADKTTKEIADELGISPHTVTNHRANISAKLNLQGSHSLLKFAFEHRSEL